MHSANAKAERERETEGMLEGGRGSRGGGSENIGWREVPLSVHAEGKSEKEKEENARMCESESESETEKRRQERKRASERAN